jgi:hypothetical protein
LPDAAIHACIGKADDEGHSCATDEENNAAGVRVGVAGA